MPLSDELAPEKADNNASDIKKKRVIRFYRMTLCVPSPNQISLDSVTSIQKGFPVNSRMKIAIEIWWIERTIEVYIPYRNEKIYVKLTCRCKW